MSQTELAQLMRERGWKWTQPTVVAVESGERPLKIAEAIDIAEIINRPLHTLVMEDDLDAEVYERANLVSRAESILLDALRNYDEARFHLATTLDRIPEGKINGRHTAYGESWIDQPIQSVVARYEREIEAEAEADRIQLGQTPEERAQDLAAWSENYGHTWNARLNRVNNRG